MSFINDIKAAVRPLQYNRRTVKYCLSVGQVDAIRKEADGDINYMMQLFFDAGFAIGFNRGRNYQKRHKMQKG